MSYPPADTPAVNGEARGRRALRHLSPPLTVLAAVLFAGGAAGYIAYLHRSPVLHAWAGRPTPAPWPATTWTG